MPAIKCVDGLAVAYDATSHQVLLFVQLSIAGGVWSWHIGCSWGAHTTAWSEI
jgi:hypothetical protein